MQVKEPCKLDPVRPFNFSLLYGAEKYSLQNMLLKQVGMVKQVLANDWIHNIWSDRVSHEWGTAWKLLESRDYGDTYLAGATDASFMVFANEVFSLVEKQEVVLTGAAVIRHTNVMSGYPP
jgi:hypothetical protein